jgi:hypothetical protein
MFKAGDFRFSFDIRSAYHHVTIFKEHQKYVSGFVFTKLLRVVVIQWRSLVVFFGESVTSVRIAWI